jgi:hypothetical protein
VVEEDALGARLPDEVEPVGPFMVIKVREYVVASP